MSAALDRLVMVGAALVWAGGVAATLASSAAMADMGELPMPGGWAMSTMWTGLCGGSAAASAISFVAMWIAMTAAMMTPVLAQALMRCRTTPAIEASLSSTALATAGYFAAWAALGAAVHLGGRIVAELLLNKPDLARAAPLAAALIVASAGALQFSAWKARRLACRRAALRPAAAPEAALLDGLRLGRDCASSCAGPTAVLLVFGVMDLRAMALVSLAVAAERLPPHGARVARLSGAAAIAAGLAMVFRAVAIL